VIRPEDVEKDLMNNLKTDCQANGGTTPVNEKENLRIAQLVDGKQDRENQNLRNEVGEKNRKNLMQLATKQDRRGCEF
jgi:hypothetical protein